MPKHRRHLEGLSSNVISLYAKGLTAGDIQAHLEEIYDVPVSWETISKITDEIAADMPDRQDQRLETHPEHTDRPLRRPDRRPHPMNTTTTGYTNFLRGPVFPAGSGQLSRVIDTVWVLPLSAMTVMV